MSKKPTPIILFVLVYFSQVEICLTAKQWRCEYALCASFFSMFFFVGIVVLLNIYYFISLDIIQLQVAVMATLRQKQRYVALGNG